jgi:plastocyanin domain-containing protein
MKIIHWKLPLSILTIVIITIFVTGCSAKPITKTTTSAVTPVAPNGEIKTIKLAVDSNYVYNPQQITVKAGTKVRIEGDPNTLTGGMDTVVVEGYDVSKKISANDNVLEFLADKPGEYSVHCANNMGDGKLIVEQ